MTSKMRTSQDWEKGEKVIKREIRTNHQKGKEKKTRQGRVKRKQDKEELKENKTRES